MGNNLVGDETNYMFQCEPFTPIYFLPKIFEEKTEKTEHSYYDVSCFKAISLKPQYIHAQFFMSNCTQAKRTGY